MGNSASSSGRGQQDDTVDFGFLYPQGVYTGPRDWNQAIVSQLIVARRLAPFYRPLEDYDDSWDDDQILAARKELLDPESVNAEQTTRIEASATSSAVSKSGHNKRPSMLKEPSKPEAAVYRGAVECPICFLYYPPNINHSRCCDQAICTECFVQIKRSEPTTTHLVSDPAACPYCVQENFGVVYIPPPWRTGIGSEGTVSPFSDSPKGSQQSIDTSLPYPTHKRRQKSFGHDSPEVVTTDQIRPDWEAKLAAVRAAVARRANRRIIMRQVGDRLIPVGVTSGRVHALSPEEAAAAAQAQAESSDGSGSRRSGRRHRGTPNPTFEQYIGLNGPDLEELMVMEAMRLSLLEHEEQQRKEAEEKKKKEAAVAVNGEQSSSSDRDSQAGPPTEPQSQQRPIVVTTGPIEDSVPPHTPRHSGGTSLTARFLPSRSRSPSPANPGSSHQHKTSNPPPFSTLSAALSTASTASAFIACNSDSAEAAQRRDDPIVSRNSTDESPVPIITVGTDALSDPAVPSASSAEAASQLPAQPAETESSHKSESDHHSSMDSPTVATIHYSQPVSEDDSSSTDREPLLVASPLSQESSRIPASSGTDDL